MLEMFSDKKKILALAGILVLVFVGACVVMHFKNKPSKNKADVQKTKVEQEQKKSKKSKKESGKEKTEIEIVDWDNLFDTVSEEDKDQIQKYIKKYMSQYSGISSVEIFAYGTFNGYDIFYGRDDYNIFYEFGHYPGTAEVTCEEIYEDGESFSTGAKYNDLKKGEVKYKDPIVVDDD